MWIDARTGEVDDGTDREFLLSRGEHAGYRWAVMHNGLGHRCGYVRIPRGHPWTRRLRPGRDDPSVGRITMELGDRFADGWSWDGGIPAEVHGDVNWACATGDGGWWLGFDTGHTRDLPDLTLPMAPFVRATMGAVAAIRETAPDAAEFFGMEVRGQDYVEDQCRSLCEQAAAAAGG